jgi:hypothetical protein
MVANTTSDFNTAVGYGSLRANTTGTNNTALGYEAGKAMVSGLRNTFVGHNAGPSNTGNDNTIVGANGSPNATSCAGLVSLGDIGQVATRIFNVTTENDRIIMGHNNISNAYVKVAWTVTSDARDKADVADAPYGLDFVNQLRPVTFKWDERGRYENLTPDGTHKNPKTQMGFLAQDVIELEESLGTPSNDLLIADNEQDDKLKITENKIIPALVKAIQELKAEFDEYKRTHP